MDLRQWIRDIPDYPKEGIIFRDLTPLMADPAAFSYTVDRFVEQFRGASIDAVAAMDARGFIFGAPVAYAMKLPFIPLRKAEKLPPEIVGVDFELEYGSDRLEVRADAFAQGDSVLVVDDLLATGGTAQAAAELVSTQGARIHAFAFVAELTFLEGRSRLKGNEAFTLVQY